MPVQFMYLKPGSKLVILSPHETFFSDKEIQIFRCFNLIKLKFLFIFTTDPYKEIDRQKVLICFTISQTKNK